MDTKNAIEVKNVSKKFKIYHDKGKMLKERAISWKRNMYDEHWVLNNISFDVKKGESIGLIGQNGCGKSTTLKLLTRIMYPDSGNIELSGRVSSLLELGAGFHPDLSGRENIYINASIFGLTKHEIDKKLDEIISFSELEEFIDSPVRTYSSGMYMRLAFSVAINVNADILLIDEILAVGDVNFQTKCFNKLMEIKNTGTTIVLVSHSTGQIERICDRSIWIENGIIKKEGKPQEVHREYLNYMCEQRNIIELKHSKKKEVAQESIEQATLKKKNKRNEDTFVKESTGDKVRVQNVRVVDKDGSEKKIYQLGDKVQLEVELFAATMIKDYYIEVNIVRADGMFCYGCSSAVDGILCIPWNGDRKFAIIFNEMNLIQGKYHFDIHLANADGSTIYFGGNIAEFEINSYELERGTVYLKHAWIEE